MMDADRKKPRKLTNNRHDDDDPSWSPDSKRIAFVSDRDGNNEIYMMDANGGNQRNITKNRHDDAYPSWAPDGRHIVFTSDRDHKHWEIYVMNTNGKNTQRLTNNLWFDFDPSWSPDGKRIAFVSYRNRIDNYEIYVMDAVMDQKSDGGSPELPSYSKSHKQSFSTRPSACVVQYDDACFRSCVCG